MVYLALGVFFAFAARTQMERRPVSAAAAWAVFVCLVWLLGLVLAPGFGVRARRLGLWVVALFLLPYGIYAVGTGDFRVASLARLAALAVVPLALYQVAPARRRRGMNWQDVVVLLWLGAPVFLGLFTFVQTPKNVHVPSRSHDSPGL